MAERGIPANPMNYTVWYVYHSGKYPGLTHTLDELLARRAPFSVERNEEIYAKYFGADRQLEEVRETSSQIQGAVSEALHCIKEAEQDTSAYGDTLSGLSGKMSATSASDSMQDTVERLLAETERMAHKSKSLEARLSESSREISELRQHLEEVQQDAFTDALTGVANRKYFDARLGEDAKQAKENGEGLCLLMADIDHFKAFNDMYGHRVGDEVLKIVSRNLKQGLKGRDTPARYGGEEFAVILPQTNLEGAAIVAEQIRSGLARRKLTNRKTGKDFGKITLSIGVAQYRPGEPLGDLIGRADAALYAAKGAGRNRVVLEAGPEPSLHLAS